MADVLEHSKPQAPLDRRVDGDNFEQLSKASRESRMICDGSKRSQTLSVRCPIDGEIIRHVRHHHLYSHRYQLFGKRYRVNGVTPELSMAL